MKIDITGSTMQELISLTQKFPQGTITAQSNKAYYEFNNVTAANFQQPQQTQQPQKKNAFMDMFNALGDVF